MKKIGLLCFLLMVSLVYTSSLPVLALTSSDVVVSSQGQISYPDWESITVSADFSRQVGLNKLSLGTQISGDIWAWLGNPTLVQKAQASNFRLIRVFTERLPPATYGPCVEWDETTLTGEYDWTLFDRVLQSIYDAGMEPLLCIGHSEGINCLLPSGMDANYGGNIFPNPESFGAYASDVAAHCKAKGFNVKYWEIWNEANTIIIEKVDNEWIANDARLNTYMQLFNSASVRIREVMPAALIGSDISNSKYFFDELVQNGVGVGFLSFHKYDSGGTWLTDPQWYYSDEQILTHASDLKQEWNDIDYWSRPPGVRHFPKYSPREMFELWLQERGEELPIICSETNLNWVYTNGADPRIQEVVGGTWYAEQLRAFILEGVSYSLYFRFSSDDSSN